MSAHPPTQDQPQLRHGALGLIDATVIAVSSTAPAYSVATALAALGAAVALQMPAAVWVGFLPVMGIAVAFYYLNRRDPNCGASYTWVSKALSPYVGFLNGWVIIVADIIFCAFAGPQAGQATLQLLNNAHIQSFLGFNLNAGDLTASTIVGLLWLLIVAYMVIAGIQIAARFQWLLCGLEYFIVLAFAITGIVKGGGSHFSWEWLDPRGFGSLATLAAGVVIAVFLYWGWDTAANINEESRDATENPGRAGLLGMVALLGIFLISTISVQMVLKPDTIVNSGANTLNLWASALAPQPWASLGVLALLSSTVATVQTTLLPGVRTTYSMGRDGVISRAWTIVSRRFQTPVIGTLIFTGIVAFLMLVDLHLDKLNAIITAGVTAIGILVSFYYGFAGIACTVYYRRRLFRSPGNFLAMGLVPTLSALVLFALAGYLIEQDWTTSGSLAFDANNGKFQVLVPVLVILSGVPVALWSRFYHNPPFFRAPREVAPPTDASPASLATQPAGAGS